MRGRVGGTGGREGGGGKGGEWIVIVMEHAFGE